MMRAALEEALVDKHLQGLIDEGCLRFGDQGTDLSKYVQPASLDVPLTSRCYLIKDKILPFGTKIQDVLNEIVLEELSLSEQGHSPILLKGHTYLAYCGTVKLPTDMRGCLSPKSSIGRIDLMVRAVFDNCGFYDTIERGSAGELWMEISPRSFNIRLRAGLSLSQMMIFQECKEPKQLLDPSTSLVYNTEGEPLPAKLHNGALILSLSVPPTNLGFEAVPTNEIIDLAEVGQLDPERFFRPLTTTITDKGKSTVTLEKDRFYVLATKERVSIPCELSAEMVPFSQHIGELRAHYAGFFDPGFGSGGTRGTIGVLEVRPHETIRVLDGQPIALMEFFRNKSVPSVPYGQAGNHYHDQTGPKLSKYFRDEPSKKRKLDT